LYLHDTVKEAALALFTLDMEITKSKNLNESTQDQEWPQYIQTSWPNLGGTELYIQWLS
jgi:hypothetical protein